MSNDSNNSDSSLNPEAPGGKPNQQASTGQGGQRSSVSATDIAHFFLTKEGADLIDKEVERRFQSQKDRGINRVEQRVDVVEKVVADYQALVDAGITPDLAKRYLRYEQDHEDIKQLKQSGSYAPQQTSLGGGANAAVNEAQSLLKEAGLENDPEATLFLREHGNSPNLTLETAHFVARRKPGAPANPALTIQPGSGGVGGKPDLKAAYQAELKTIRRGDVDAVARLQIKYRQQAMKEGIEPPC